MIICGGCGSAMEDDLRFCTECGTPNPTMRITEATVSSSSAPTSQDAVSEQVKSQNVLTPQASVPLNQATPRDATPAPNLLAQQTATTSNRTPIMIFAAVIAGLVLLLLGAVGSRRLLSDNKPAARTVEVTQIATPSPTAVPTPTPPKKRIQVTLKPGRSSDPFSFNKNGDVVMSGNTIGTCKSDNKYETAEVYISGPSNIKDYYYVLCLISEQGGISGHIVSGETNAVVSSGFIPPNWSVGTWVSWAPEDKYALTYATGEVTMGDMVLIDLNGGKSGALSFKRVAAPDSGNTQTEVQNINEKTIRWIDAHTFTVRLEVTCNPYELTDCDPNKILRRYRVTVDVATGSQKYDQH